MAHNRGHKGLLYYSEQDEKGTPVNPILPIGDYENLRARTIGGVEPIRPAGSRTVLELVEGRTGLELGFDITNIQASNEQATYLNLGIASPVTTALTYVTHGYGTAGGTDYQAEDGKIDSISFSGDAEGSFSGSVSVMAGKVGTPSPVLSEPQSYLSVDPTLQMHEAVYSEFEVVSIRGEYRNNLVMKPVIAGSSTTRDPGRNWDYLTEGPLDVSGSYTLLNVSGHDLQSNEITAVDPTLAFVDKGASADELLISITGWKPQDETMTIPGADGDIEWELPWIAQSLTWATTEY